MSSRRPCAALAALALIAGAAPTIAQEAAGGEHGLALDRFQPSPAGDRMFGVPSPMEPSLDEAHPSRAHVMLLVDYAHNPLVLRQEGSDEDVGAVVSDQLFLHLAGAVTAWERMTVSFDVPVALAQGGDNPGAEGLSFQSPSGAEMGDLRLGARVRLLGKPLDPFQLAAGAYFWLPTADGDAGSFVGEGAVRGLPQVIAGGVIDSLIWSATLGFDLRLSQVYQQVPQGTMLQGGAGVGWLLGPQKQLQVGPEITIATVLEDPGSRNTNLEALFGGRYRIVRQAEVGLGIGGGITRGIGTPDFRLVALLSHSLEEARPPADRDHDGIADTVDACPDIFGVPNEDPARNGCPPPADRDGDGIPDTEDACPDVAGVPNADPTRNGCPPPGDRDGDGITDDVDACPDKAGVPSADPELNGCPPADRDGDGIPDSQDACPDIKGIKTNDPATNGCPGDKDGDTIRDDKDACPNEKGKPDPDPQKNGCPTSVRVTAGEIVILQQVQFDFGKSTIKRESNPLLDEVADVLKQHPEIVKIEVQGHTDNRGGHAFNMRLSQARADSVKQALEKRGIQADYIDAKGYGPDVPIADNGTDEGRQKNRRVQFKILERKGPQP